MLMERLVLLHMRFVSFCMQFFFSISCKFDLHVSVFIYHGRLLPYLLRLLPGAVCWSWSVLRQWFMFMKSVGLWGSVLFMLCLEMQCCSILWFLWANITLGLFYVLYHVKFLANRTKSYIVNSSVYDWTFFLQRCSVSLCQWSCHTG